MAKASTVCTVLLSIAVVVGVIFAVVGGVMFPVFQYIIHNEIVKETMLKNGTTGYDNWKNPTADVYLQFWTWDLLNPEEVQAGKEPFLAEKGPYTYREVMLKEDITSHSNGTISYIQQKTYILDLDMSVGDPRNDSFTTINIPLMTSAAIYPYLNGLEKIFIDPVMKKAPVFQSRTVEELIWGYPDELTKLAHLAKRAPFEKFGLFVDRNNSNDGIYTVYSGVNTDDTSKINNIARWKGQSELPYWSTPEANMINGSDGSYNPPFFKKNKMMYVFSSDICRSINAVFEKDTDVRDISTWRYVGPPEAFANATENPANEGFCTPNATYCLPSGLLNISNCQFGAPIVMSLPHFLYCDKTRVIDLVHGVEPNKELHQTFFDIEPMTGGPLNVAKRLQINVYMEPFDFPKQLNDLSTLFLPVVWLNESALLTESGANQLKSQVETPILLTTIAKIGVLSIGVLLIAIGIVGLTVKWIRKPSEATLQQSTPNMVNPAHPGLQDNSTTAHMIKESTPLLA